MRITKIYKGDFDYYFRHEGKRLPINRVRIHIYGWLAWILIKILYNRHDERRKIWIFRNFLLYFGVKLKNWRKKWKN